MSDIINVRQNADLQLNYALRVGPNQSTPIPGTIRYNSTEDRIEAYLAQEQTYNNSNWAPMSFAVATPTDLGGVKIGNNLTITSSGVLSAVAGAPSRQLQRVVSVCQRDNTGDYTNIQDCLSGGTGFFGYKYTGTPVVDWTTSNGALAGLHADDPVNFPWPDASNLYIIQVSPGVYQENSSTIRLPPYVVLQGDTTGSVVIRNNPTASNAMIWTSTGSVIERITVDMTLATTATNTVGILCNEFSEGTQLRDITITTTDISVPKIGISLVGADNISIVGAKADIELATAQGTTSTNTLTLISASGANNMAITGADLSIIGNQNSKTACIFTNNTTARLSDSKINIQELNSNVSLPHQDTGIILQDSSADLVNCQIAVLGLDNKDSSATSQLCQGIRVIDTVAPPPIFTPMGAPTEFIHYNNFDDNDEIYNSAYNWQTTAGFKIGDYLMAVAPTSLTAANRSIFQIRGFVANGSGKYSMQLDNSISLDDQTFADGLVSFQKFNNIGIYNSRITSASQTIYVAPSGAEGANFRIQSAYSVLDGQNPELAEAYFILTVPQQITVGLQDCDFLSLADACDSIKDSGPNKPYEILVQPGLFIERRTIRIPSYVSVVGQGQNITILKFEQADIGSAPYDILAAGITNTAIVLGSDTQNYFAGLTRLSIQIPNGLNNKNILDTQITGIRVATNGGARLSDNSLVMGFSVSTPITTGASIKGIAVVPSAIVLAAKYYLQRVNVDLGISAQGADIRAFSFTTTSYAALTDCRAEITSIVSLAGRLVYGIWSDRSKLDITAPYILLDIDGNAPGGAGYGVLSIDTTITPPAPTGDTTYSQTPVIIYGGQVRATGIVGDVLYSVFADYASTLFALNTAVQGTAASRNDLLDTYPNSLLKTYKCYYFSSDGTSFINVGDLDPAGNEMGGTNDNLNVGDPVGVAEMFGVKNVQVGIRTGTLNQAGNRNTMLGVDVGRQINTGNNNVLLGYAAGNNMVASNTTLVGAFCGQNLTGSSSQEIVMMGTDAGAAATSAQNTVIIGAKTAKSVVGATGSTVIGARTAGAATGLTDTIILGGNTATGLGTSTRDILIGTDSVNVLGTSTDNLVMGTRAAQNTTTMTTSVLLGNETGKNRLTTQESVLVGFGAAAGSSGTIPGNTGARNIAIGHQSAAGLSSGSDNFIAGARAGSQITTGSFNTIIGSGQTAQTTAGGSLTSGSYNLIAGTNTANSLTTGSKNVVLGSESGNKLTTQTDTFILGYNSGGNLTNSTSIIIGNESGKQVSDGGALIIGHGSGTNAGGSDLLIIGHNCARGLTGARNTIIGNYGAGASGAVVLSGTDNVLIGAYAGYQLTTGSHNVLIGSGDQTNSTGRSLTAGSGNMIFGYQTAPQLSSGSDNLIFGKQSAYNLAVGNRNIYLGAEAGSQMSSGSENVIIGNEAGKNLSSGTGIVLIGNRAGYNATGNGSVSDNLFIGNEAGYSIVSGFQNTIIGNQTGHSETTGFQNTYIGNFAAQNLTAAKRNICVGYFAGAGIDPVASKNSEDNIMMGSFAGQKITEGYQNILIGTKAGSNIQARAKNIMIGPYVGAESNASLNIFIGGTTSNSDETGRSVGYWANGNYNIVLGTNAGLDLASAERNIIMGYEAGEKVNSGSQNIIMGQMAGNRLTTGNNNILVGQNTGVSISGAIGLQTGNNVIAIGTRAGGNIGSAVNDSILIGTEAGFKTQVDNTICIGPSAGSQNMTGAGGISIGYRAGLSSVAAEGCISIGSNAGAAFTGMTQVGQNISIGDESATNNQGTRNIVIGAEAAINTSNASNVIVIGYQAGANIGGLPSSTGINPDNGIIIGFRAGADGDIGADNILIGAKAGESIDNPRVVARNIIVGAGAGRVSNLAVDSIVLGQAGREGTGGVKNILMGSGAGDVLGNPAPVYPLTTHDILAESCAANINMGYDQARLFFKEGDMLLIESSTVSYQIQLGGIINPAEYYNNPTDPILNSITRLVLTQPYPSGATSIPTGAQVRSLGNLDTGNVGLVDESKASGNSLVGESAGGNLTTGSKSVAFGTGALATNQIAKYNNAIGTEAAYNAISDNNTCLGTRAGYSIDLYDGLSYSSNAVSFSPDNNIITFSGGDGFVVPTDEFRFGTVFDVAGSTLNDGRYTVSSANSSSITINGIPKYEALGVPLNVSAEDLRVNSATFTFNQVSFDGSNAGGIAVGKDPFSLPGTPVSRIYSLSASTWSALDNTNVFKITGSKYNDGVYYKATDTSGSSNSYPIYGQFYPEIFDGNVQITAQSINSTDTISSGITFNDYQIDAPFYAFFGQNKGTYRIGNQQGSQQPTQSSYSLARPLSNCALVSSTSLVPSIAEDNIIFTTGYQELDSISAANLRPTANISVGYQNHYSFQKYQIFGQVDIYTTNSTIYFDNQISRLVADLANASIFCLDCPNADNDKLLIRITSAPDNNTLLYEVIRSTSSGPVDETINADAVSNPMYLTHSMIKNLDRDVSTTFSNLGFIKLSSEYNMGLDVHTGDYLIDTVLGNSIILADDQVLPIMASNLGSVQILPPFLGYDLGISGQVKTTMVREYLGMESSYLFDPKISGTDIMIQSGRFNPTTDPAYSYTINNTTKTITADKDYVFTNLVAPCVIKLLGEYFLVIANDYPFRTLRIDPEQDLSSVVSATIDIIEYNSISSHSGYTQLDSLVAGSQYEILGGGDNNRLIITPLGDIGAINKQSVYVSNTAPMITYNTNKTVLGLYSPTTALSTSEIQNQITPRGYFKRMFQPSANLTITLNSSNCYYEPLKGYSALNGNLSAVSADQIVIQPSITPEKYSLNNIGTNTNYEPMASGVAHTFWDTANSDVFANIALPTSNTITIYGEQFSEFKISPNGFLVFEGAGNIHTVNFQTTNDTRFAINSASVDSNVSVKYINDGNSTDGADNVLVINYATNNSGASSGWGKSSDNNLELRVYMDNTGNSAGRIILNYSDTQQTLKSNSGLDSNTYVVLGIESTQNTIEKETRYTTNLINAADSNATLITCYQPSSAENGNFGINLTANTYLYSQCTANSTGSNPYYFTSSPAVSGSNFGAAVDMWGRQMIIGAPGDGSSIAGNAFIYSADGSEYKGYLYSADVISGAAAEFGYSVAIWGDRAVVGAPGNSGVGNVHVFDWNGSNWVNTANLGSAITTGRFGHAVDIYDSNTIVVGAPTTANTAVNPGSAHIFEFDGSNWIEAAYFNDFANYKGTGSYFGNSVAIWGSNVIVGAPGTQHFSLSYDTGSITVYKKSSGIWSESQVLWGNWVGRTPAASLSTPYYNFGWSVDINNDYIIGGYPGYYNGITANNGAVLTYTHSGGSWNFDNIILQGPTTNFGYDVSLNTKSLYVSEYINGYPKVSEFTVGGSWTATSEIYQPGTGGQFGKAIASWGKDLVIGSPLANVNIVSLYTGLVYVPKVDSLVLPLSYGAQLNNSAATYEFGQSIAANSNSIAIGAPSISSSGTTPNGAVWIYRPSDNIISGWTEDASMPIQPDNLDAYSDASGFGYSVSLDADWLVAGAPYFNTATTTDSGRVYIYETDNYLSGSYARIDPPNPESSGLFGYSVSQDSGKLVIGAPGELSGQGNVYVYNYSAPNWVQDANSPITVAGETGFSNIVVTRNNCILVRAASATGTTYLYKDSDLVSTPDFLIPATDTPTSDYGYAITLSDRFAVVSDPLHNASLGAVYIFERQGSAFGQFVSGTTYNETIKITAQTPQGYSSTRFGSGVVLGQDILVVSDGSGNSGSINDYFFVYKYNPAIAANNPSESWSLVQFFDSTQSIGVLTKLRSMSLYGKELLVGWPEYSSSIGRVKSYNYDPLATAKYQITRSNNTGGYYIPDWTTHTPVSGDLQYLQLGSNMINIHGQQSNTIAISKWGYLYTDKTQYVSLVEPLNGHYFDTAYWQIDNNILTATLVDTTTSPNVIVQVSLYTTASRYANNMEMTYLNLEQLTAGGNTFTGYSGLSHNLYNIIQYNYSTGGIDNSATSDISTTPTEATLIFNSYDSSMISNILLIENQDIIQLQGMTNSENNGYFTVATPVSNIVLSEQSYKGPGQLFTNAASWDLSGKTLTFTPNVSATGYSWTINNSPAWTSSPLPYSAYSNISLTGDDTITSISLANDFKFYGVDYSTLYFANNGYFSFGSSDSDYDGTYQNLYNSINISGLRRDINVEDGGSISYGYSNSSPSTPNDTFIGTWLNVPNYEGDPALNNFQIVLYLNNAPPELAGNIVINYGNLTFGSTEAVVGLSNSGGESEYISQGEGVDLSFDSVIADYYMTIRHTGITTAVEEFEVLTANTTINEFRSYSAPTPSSANSDIDFMNLYSSYGNTTAFLRFAKCYQSPMSNITGITVSNASVIESSLNYTVATWNNSNVVSNVAVGLLETVPAEYSTALSKPSDLDNYLVALGTPVPDFAGNLVVEQQNIKTPPIGYIHNYMYRDISTNSNLVQSPSYLFSSNLSKISWGGTGISGNISISSGNITLSELDSAGGPNGGLIDLGLGRWDYGFKDVINKPFAGVKPGMLLNISNSGGYSANVMVANTVIGSGGELLNINCDGRFSNLANINSAWDFITGGEELTIQLLNPVPNNQFGMIDELCAQLISDRYNFAAVSNISLITTNQTGSYVAKLPIVNAIGSLYGNKYSYMNNYSIPNNKRKKETSIISEDNTNIVKVLPFRASSGINNKWMIDDLGVRLWIVPREKLVNENPFSSVLYFINEYWASIDIVISNTGSTLTTTTPGVDFTVLQPGVIVNLLSDKYAQIASIDSATQLTFNTDYNTNVPLVDGTYNNTTINVNIIGSVNTSTVNLAYFKPGQRIIVSKTDTPNDSVYYTSFFAPTSPECIYIEPYFGSVTTAYPEFGVIERAMFGYEIYPLGFNGFTTTTAVPPSIYNTFEIPYDEGITSNTLATFKSGDQVDIISGALSGTYTVPTDLITQPYAIPFEGLPAGLDDNNPLTLTKSVAFRVIGKAISTTTDAGIVKFHYTDAQGNNIMIGSFTGQYAGATGLSIHNLFLGNKVGQTNQGSGNVFFGSETGFATDASQGATAYDNKLAIYKNNFIGVPSDPLIGGDFASGRVGVGTIDPDGKLLATLGTRTLMVVDGKVRAQAFTTFTGTHFVILDIETEPVKPELGMVLSSRGRVHKLGLLDNITECQLSTRVMDKRVYGVYAGDEMINGRQIAHCAAVGEGSILVSTINGEPENGDYLCSSPIPGLAQLQPDDLLHNYTVAKLIEDVNWSAVSRYISYEGQEYKVALVACSYHCA
jgi:hypothetical protein